MRLSALFHSLCVILNNMRIRLNKYLTVPVGFALLILSMLLWVGSVNHINNDTALSTRRIRLATTTSLYDSGLWEILEPIIEKELKIELDIIYAGTRQALEYGRRGDVHLLATHDRVEEEKFIQEGYGARRTPFAYNYFLLIGPDKDSAGIKGLKVVEAFKRIYAQGQINPESVRFVSRGDNSGTHSQEKRLWKIAGFDYENNIRSEKWYLEAGSGMGPTLLLTDQKKAYTITDKGTYLTYSNRIKSTPIIDKENELLNIYSLITLNPDKFPFLDLITAQKVNDLLISDKIQNIIAEFGVQKYGTSLFLPGAGVDFD